MRYNWGGGGEAHVWQWTILKLMSAFIMLLVVARGSDHIHSGLNIPISFSITLTTRIKCFIMKCYIREKSNSISHLLLNTCRCIKVLIICMFSANWYGGGGEYPLCGNSSGAGWDYFLYTYIIIIRPIFCQDLRLGLLRFLPIPYPLPAVIFINGRQPIYRNI